MAIYVAYQYNKNIKLLFFKYFMLVDVWILAISTQILTL